jgi:hypothetical protein
MTTQTPTHIFFASLLCLAACGGDAEVQTIEAEPTEPGGGAEVEPAEPDPSTSGVRVRDESEIPVAPKPWEEMTMEEKGAFMNAEVQPYMAELFREYDSEEFATFNCGTCHGEDMQERNFEMPAPSLPALHESGTPEQEQMVQDHPRMVRFMFNHVVPAMRTMIRAEPFDPDTGEGFSCFTCHPKAGDVEAAEGDEVAALFTR